MSNERGIPIVVGVTGHRVIRAEDRAAISASVKTELQKLRNLCPASDLVLLSSLAEGGDLLCADAATELGIPILAVLPMERDRYVQDFSNEEREHFDRHCAEAKQMFAAPFTEEIPPEGITRDFLFRQAGIYIALHCHVMLALWDGGPGTRAACGTAATVDFALNGSYSPKTGIPLRSERNEAVIHIFTPRADRTEEAAGTVHLLGDRDAVLDLLWKTEDFNRRSGEVQLGSDSRLPSAAEDDPCLERMERIGRTAGRLSSSYAKRFRRVLMLLAVSSALLTFAFLLYDNIQILWMILVCGLMLLAAWFCQSYAARSDCHRRYVEYRVLSECLRVQTYMRYAGSAVRAAELLTWTQQEETAWIMTALCALTIGEAPKERHDIRSCWVEEQRKYHREAEERSLHRLRISENTVHTALILSIALYIAAVAFELFCGNLFFRPIIRIEEVDLCRTILKVFLGTISAVTLFVANYYGRLSLPRTLSDHRKMERFFSRMSDLLQTRGQTEELLTLLAKEELIENGNWCSYQRDNKPDISI